MRFGWRSKVVGLGMVPALAACAPGDCSGVGCASQVGVTNLSDLVRQYGPGPAAATLCVDGSCQTERVVLSGSAAVLSVLKEIAAQGAKPSSMKVHVTFQLSRRGSSLMDAATTTSLTSVAPNGVKCGPICYDAIFTVKDGELVLLAPDS